MNTTSTVVVASIAVIVSGCAAPPERELSTEEVPYSALPTGRDPLNPDQFVPRPEGAVFWATKENLLRTYEARRGHALNILQLSGGGQNGAFGAGFLKGWTESGTRPEFDMVTGVSTGALLASHAFLGTPADDAVLEEIFTSVTADDIFTRGGALAVLGGAPSLLDTAPLAALLEKYITAEVLARVAAEHDKGRRLIVAATNLDYNRTYMFNLGRMAKQGGPEALARYRQVLMASSSFPIMFPPVEIDGHLFADGAVRANILVLGLSGAAPPGPPLHGPGNVYLILNGREDIPPTPVEPTVFSLAGRTLGEMMSVSNERLLVRSFFAAKVHDYEFHSVQIPAGVDIGNDPLAFDQEQMRAGFDAGYRLAKQPNPWLNEPPLLEATPEWALEIIKDRL